MAVAGQLPAGRWPCAVCGVGSTSRRTARAAAEARAALGSLRLLLTGWLLV